MADRHAVDASVIKGAEAIDMREEGSHGVLLLHGFGDTPQTLSLYAKHLSKAGFAVFAPLLPGHGRTLDDKHDRMQGAVAHLREIAKVLAPAVVIIHWADGQVDYIGSI